SLSPSSFLPLPDALPICFSSAQPGLTSTRVSLKQAPSARSARISAETSAEIVCPVRLVDSQAPFSLATISALVSADMRADLAERSEEHTSGLHALTKLPF